MAQELLSECLSKFLRVVAQEACPRNKKLAQENSAYPELKQSNSKGKAKVERE